MGKCVLVLCMANVYEGPDIVKYLRDNWPDNHYIGAGVNEYFTPASSHFVTADDVEWADLIVYAEDVHYEMATKLEHLRGTKIAAKDCISLNLEYEQNGPKNHKFLLAAGDKLSEHL